jgi:predicted ester cyclase
LTDLKEQARRFYASLDGQDWEETMSLAAPGFTAQVGSLPPMSFTDWRRGLEMFYAGFPDGRHLIDDYVVEDNRVVTRCRFEGTHEGAFFGVPPTGSKVSIGVIHIDRFASGKLIEHFGQLDLLGLMLKIGAIPPAPDTSA